jgi:VanZ family protein
LARWAPPFAWAALLFALSHQPGGDLPALFEGADKVAHVLLYAPLGFLLGRAVGVAWLAVLLATAYGVTDEWHQLYVPGRSPSIADVVADAIGATLGAALWVIRRSPVAGGEPG